MWTKICKNAICLLFTNLQIHNLATLLPGRPSLKVVRNGFLNNKQMAFLQIFVSQQLLFLFSKHLDTMLNVTDCGPGRTDLCSNCSLLKIFYFRTPVSCFRCQWGSNFLGCMGPQRGHFGIKEAACCDDTYNYFRWFFL